MIEQKIIAIEGIDGSGKTTLIQNLTSIINQMNFTADSIRLKNRDCSIVNYYDQNEKYPENQYMKLSAYTFDLLHDIDCLCKMEGIEYIFFDRYVDCLDAYFGSLNIHIHWVQECKKLIPAAYRTYILDLPVELAISRIKVRNSKINVLENEDFLSRVKEKYINLAQKEKCMILDARLDTQTLCEIILKDLNMLK